MKISDFHFDLPEERIAQRAAEPRDSARMMVLHRAGRRIEHRLVRDLPEYLNPGDLLVLNDTRVIPARVFGVKEASGGRVEVLFLEENADGTWDALLRAGSARPQPGIRVRLGGATTLTVELVAEGEKGRCTLRVVSGGPVVDFLQREGVPPLPPYIRRAPVDDATPGDRNRYQTVYARDPGSVAAPTAGLHFTPGLFEALSARGVDRAFVTLHVGLGTFRPVTAADPREHRMEGERFEVSPDTAARLAQTRAAGGRVVAVGSTTVRTLETMARDHGGPAPCRGRSDLFIHGPFAFRMTDAMLTNFHLPCSTLLMMVCALAGREFTLHAYEEAVRLNYRFYSYGDCMLVL